MNTSVITPWDVWVLRLFQLQSGDDQLPACVQDTSAHDFPLLIHSHLEVFSAGLEALLRLFFFCVCQSCPVWCGFFLHILFCPHSATILNSTVLSRCSPSYCYPPPPPYSFPSVSSLFIKVDLSLYLCHISSATVFLLSFPLSRPLTSPPVWDNSCLPVAQLCSPAKLKTKRQNWHHWKAVE